MKAEIDIDKLIAKLRKVKQKEYTSAVYGSPSKPDEVVDSVVFALRDLFTFPEPQRRLYEEVVNFYPDV